MTVQFTDPIVDQTVAFADSLVSQAIASNQANPTQNAAGMFQALGEAVGNTFSATSPYRGFAAPGELQRAVDLKRAADAERQQAEAEDSQADAAEAAVSGFTLAQP